MWLNSERLAKTILVSRPPTTKHQIIFPNTILKETRFKTEEFKPEQHQNLKVSEEKILKVIKDCNEINQSLEIPPKVKIIIASSICGAFTLCLVIAIIVAFITHFAVAINIFVILICLVFILCMVAFIASGEYIKKKRLLLLAEFVKKSNRDYFEAQGTKWRLGELGYWLQLDLEYSFDHTPSNQNRVSL